MQKVVIFPPSDSQSVATNATAPGASAVLATITPAKGVYEIRVRWLAGAAGAAADDGNVRLDANGSAYLGAVPEGVEVVIPRLTLNGSSPVRLVVLGAATAAVVYTGAITVTRIG